MQHSYYTKLIQLELEELAPLLAFNYMLGGPVVRLTYRGEENSYYTDEFDNQYFCKTFH